MLNFFRNRFKQTDVKINLIDEDNKIFGIVEIPEPTFDLISKAAALVGQSPVDFIKSASLAEADHIVAEVSPSHCDNCGALLQEVFAGSSKEKMFLDALEIYFDGGYGMYIDNDHMVNAMICKTCVEHLLETMPGLAMKLR